MTTMKIWRKSRLSECRANLFANGRARAIYVNTLVMCAAMLSLASCSSEPEYADPEAHEKTVQLNERYAPLMVGTWHYEKIGERQRYFERLTFKDDRTFTGYRKWQCRELVIIDGKEQYTDWQNAGQPTGWGDEEGPMNGTFTGT